MPTNKKTISQAEPELEETFDPEELLYYFEGHAGTFGTFKTLQGMFNDHIANGQLQGYTDEALQDFMHHFIIISEVIYRLETLAANRLINKLKAGKASPSKKKEELVHQANKIYKAMARKKAS